MLVLAADVMTGSRLQLSSLMGLQPVVGGRFYGMGNVTFALFATATIMLCIAVADHFVRAGRRRVAVGAIDRDRPRRRHRRRVTGLGQRLRRAAGVPAGTGLLRPRGGRGPADLAPRPGDRRRHRPVPGRARFADWLRPPESRSHLGRFVQTAIDGGAATIILRKARQNWDILTSTTLDPAGADRARLRHLHPGPTRPSWGSRALHRAYERAPLLRPGLVSLLVLFLIGFAANDSGTAIPAVGATLALPLVIAISVRTLLDETSSAETTTPAVPAPAREARPATRRTARRSAAPPA